MDLILFAEKRLKELRCEKLRILRANEKIPASLLTEIKYHRKVIRMTSKQDLLLMV